MYTPGTDHPIHMDVSAQFASQDVFYFSVNNYLNLNNQGEDVGDAFSAWMYPPRS